VEKGVGVMRRIIATSVLGIILLGSAFAASAFKFTFPDVTYTDGRTGTITASVKTTKNGTVTVVDFYSSPNDKFLGEFQGTDNTSTDAVVVRDYALLHFADRTPQN
jgi:hypothetical protein